MYRRVNPFDHNPDAPLQEFDAITVRLSNVIQFAQVNVQEFTLTPVVSLGVQNRVILNVYDFTQEDYLRQMFQFYERHRAMASEAKIYLIKPDGAQRNLPWDLGNDVTYQSFYEWVMNCLQSNEQLELAQVQVIMAFTPLLLVRGKIKPNHLFKGLEIIDGGNEGNCFYIALLHHILKDPICCRQLIGSISLKHNRNKAGIATKMIQQRLTDQQYPCYSFAMNRLKESLPFGIPTVYEDYLNQVVSIFPRIQIIVFFWDNRTVSRSAIGKDLFNEMNIIGSQFPQNPIARDDPEYVRKKKEMQNLTLILYHSNNHVDIVSNLFDFLQERKGLCYFCHKVFFKQEFVPEGQESVDNHECLGVKKCEVCLRDQKVCQLFGDHSEEESFECPICGVTSSNQNCMTYHHDYNGCRDYKIQCDKCPHEVYKSLMKKHVCGTYYCKKCKDKFTGSHQCRFPKKGRPKIRGRIYYGFDFECLFENLGLVAVNSLNADGIPEERDIPLQKHVVNFVACQNLEGGLMHTFENFERFLVWMENLQEECEHHFFAHNMGKYDGRLFYSEYVKIRPQFPIALWSGQKLLQMMIPSQSNNPCIKLYIRDSLPHISQSLDSFTKTFDLDPNQFKKGYFPYDFNVPENQHYVGPIPDKKFFNSGMMKQGRREKFEEWHAQQTGIYDFQKELREYCISDVILLNSGLKKYRDEMLELTKIDPLTSLTIASVAMTHFQTNHYNAKKFPIYPLSKEDEQLIKPSFKGGRTDCRFMVVEDKNLSYDDMNSLYPSQQVFGKIPYGPIWKDYDNLMDKLENFDGIAMIDYIVTQFHFHPIPVLISEDGKLVADLLDHEKVTMTSMEIQAMLQSGYYRITKVHWIIHTKVTLDFFGSYMSEVYGGKTLNSRNPSDHDVADSEELYEFTNHKIDIRGKEFSNNPGKKAIFKLLCNSLWGKFAQRDDYNSTVTVDPTQFMKAYGYLKEQKVDIINMFVHPNNPDQMLITMSGEKKDFLRAYEKVKDSSVIRNILLASFVTAQARLKLWEKLNFLGSRVVYHDTDSIIYVAETKEDRITEGQLLGHWECEIEEEEVIDRYVSTGPKSYAYRVRKTDGSFKHVCKVKGHSLNEENAQYLSYQELKNVVMDKQQVYHTNELKFNYHRNEGLMVTRPQVKIFRQTYSKGVVLPDKDYVVMPFGYQRFEPFSDPQSEWSPWDLK